MYIAANAAKFLDHEWVDMAALCEFLQQQAQNSTTGASTTRASTITDTIRIKIEATPSSAVKAEPQIARMRTLNNGGREIFELLSDSEPETDQPECESDLEVIEALQRDSRSSSLIPLAAPSDHLPDDDSDSAEPDIHSTALNGAFFFFQPGPKLILTAKWGRLGIGRDNDGWEWTGSSNRGAQVTFAPGEDPVDCRRVRYDCDRLDPALRSTVRFELDPASRDAIIAAQQETRRKEGNTAEERAILRRVGTNILLDAVVGPQNSETATKRTAFRTTLTRISSQMPLRDCQ
ncbi:hypothetical protein B0H10DRAFT_1949699 [Mycena sp. CBHHK59/15]|nr:hypothetical protein B0H10DRAFT_1949699 [Mycena sp. CBHHK59/15]